MALLQLAEGYGMLAQDMYLADNGTVADNYLFIPSGMFGMTEDTYVRSDFFDSLSDTEFETVMSNLAPYQPQGLSQIGAIATAAQIAGKTLSPAIKKAFDNRQEKIAAGTAKPIFKPGGNLANLAGKIKAGVQKLKNVPTTKQNEVIEKTTPISGSVEVGGTTLDFSTGQPATEPFFTKYKTPLIVGGVAIAGFLLYKVLNKK